MQDEHDARLASIIDASRASVVCFRWCHRGRQVVSFVDDWHEECLPRRLADRHSTRTTTLVLAEPIVRRAAVVSQERAVVTEMGWMRRRIRLEVGHVDS